MSATATTVTVDRQALYDLIVEAHAVGNVLSRLLGDYPAAVTNGLHNAAYRAALSAFGDDVEVDGDKSGIHKEFDDADRARAGEIERELGFGGAG
jgi:hypothetical protein